MDFLDSAVYKCKFYDHENGDHMPDGIERLRFW